MLSFRLPLALLVSATSLAAAAAPVLESAVALYEARRYPEARVALEQLTAAEPANAAACYYLGMTLRRRGDAQALDDAVVWLARAAELEPGNARYLADYGGTSLQLAAKNTSFGAATRGRDALEKSLVLDPTNIDARIGLMQFYTRAPWPLGSKTKAKAQLDEIRRLDPARALALEVAVKAGEKDFAGAFQLCDAALAKNPADYNALYQYGRTASLSGENLARGLETLRQCINQPEPGRAAPTHSDAWRRIGLIHEKLGQRTEARAAYETALKLNPANRAAAEALAKLPPP